MSHQWKAFYLLKSCISSLELYTNIKLMLQNAIRFGKFLANPRTLKLLAIITLITVSVVAMHTAFLSNWQLLYGSTTSYIKSSSEIYGTFQIHTYEYLNASIDSIIIEPTVPFNYTLEGETLINLDQKAITPFHFVVYQ
jgi:hypothetical protein